MHDKKKYTLIEEDGILRVSPLPDAKELSAWYQDHYYHAPQNISETDIPISPDNMQHYEHAWLEFALQQSGLSKLNACKMLDMGCGNGFHIRKFGENNWDAYGIDFSENVIQHHSPSLLKSRHFERGDILSERFFPHIHFDFVLAKNILEHVIDPVKCLASIKDYLKADGIACIVVPNDYSIIHQAYLGDKDKTEAGFFNPPDHLSYFNTAILETFISNNGFRVVDAFCDYPIDQFLLNENTNYYENESFGPTASDLRDQIVKLLTNQSVENTLDLFRAFYKNGIGRNIYCFVRAT